VTGQTVYYEQSNLRAEESTEKEGGTAEGRQRRDDLWEIQKRKCLQRGVQNGRHPAKFRQTSSPILKNDTPAVREGNLSNKKMKNRGVRHFKPTGG